MKKEMNRNYYVLQLMKVLREYIPNMILAIVVKTIDMILPFIIMVVVGQYMGRLISGLTTSIVEIGMNIGLLIAGMIIFSFLDTYISHDMSFRIVKKLRNVCYEKISRILPSTNNKKSPGDYARIITGDVEVFEWFYAHIFVAFIATAITMIVGIYLLSTYSVEVLIIVLLCSVIINILPRLNTSVAEEKGYVLRSLGGELNAVIVDGILGVKDIISNQYIDSYDKNLIKCSEQFDQAQNKYQQKGMNEKRVVELIIDITVIVSIGIVLFSNGLDIGEKITTVLITVSFFAPLQQTLSDGANYGFVFGAAKRVYDLLNEEENVIDDGNMIAADVYDSKSERIRLDIMGLEFAYPLSDKKVLNNITFDATAGESVAIVAKSGGGKSTFVNLMQRFWDYDSGSIMINGIDIKKLKISELRKLVTVVSQDIYMFNMSIRDNLLMARDTATVDEINRACEMARVLEYTDELEDGLDTMVGERGQSMSGGQRQRLALTQAFLRDTPVLIMDEATSNLDVYNENIINSSINQIKQNKVVIIIAHRIETIKKADKIVVLKDGKVHDIGGYTELLARSYYFRELIGEEYKENGEKNIIKK